MGIITGKILIFKIFILNQIRGDPMKAQIISVVGELLFPEIVKRLAFHKKSMVFMQHNFFLLLRKTCCTSLKLDALMCELAIKLLLISFLSVNFTACTKTQSSAAEALPQKQAARSVSQDSSPVLVVNGKAAAKESAVESSRSQVQALNCGQVRTKIEKMICANKAIIHLDLLMNAAYLLALEETEFKSILKSRQIVWLNEVRGKCSDDACLERVYKKQIQELKQPVTVSGAEILGVRSGKLLTTPAPSTVCDITDKKPYFNKKIPKNKYIAYYFCDDNFIGTEIVDAISINYASSEFLNIPSNRFRAIWETNIEPSKGSQSKVLSASVSGSDVKVFLDDNLLQKWTGNDKELPIIFSKKSHRLRVEYANQRHTVNFSASFANYPKIKLDEASHVVLPLINDETKAVYIGAYESKNLRNQVVVTIPKIKSPIVLFLSSYSVVNWKIENPSKTKIAGVFFSSYEKGSSVISSDDGQIINLVGLGYAYENFDEISEKIMQISGIAPYYKYGEYGLSQVVIPAF